jgi:hypothetical protein
LKSSDKRHLINVKGAATLYLKYVKTKTNYLFASAFCKGSERVATAISTLHSKHHWEGIALKPAEELQAYKRDTCSLQSLFFCPVDDLDALKRNTHQYSPLELKDAMDRLFDNIEPLTLRQGMLSFMSTFHFILF